MAGAIAYDGGALAAMGLILNPISPRYRALLRNVPGLERPVQCFANTLPELETWAKAILGQYNDTAAVTFYERVELTRHTVKLGKSDRRKLEGEQEDVT